MRLLMSNEELREFVRESNKIEGIVRDPTREEVDATQDFIDLPVVEVADVEALVAVFAPGKLLRRQPGMNVRVGNHIAPAGGPYIEPMLAALLNEVCHERVSAFVAHSRYCNLHPFMDGNGRSGRAIWLWQMRSAPLGFLHKFYYQTLDAQDRSKA